MNRKTAAVRIAVGCVLVVSSVVGVERVWLGGEGLWSDATKWNPNGVPGSASDDIATIPATDACALNVESNVVLARVHADATAAGGSLTFNVAPGATLAADALRLRASHPMECLVTGGGTFALTNAPFGVGYIWSHPSHFTVSGEGTVFSMPKAAASGLYVGSTADDLRSVDNVFRVTAGAKAIISNATCVGQGYLAEGDGNTAATKSGGRLLVDDGGYFYGGTILFIGRNLFGIANRGEAAVCAVTNGTLAADLLTFGSSSYTFFTGSNALVRANNIQLPQVDCSGRYQTTFFEDSVFAASQQCQLLAGGQFNTNAFRRCRMSTPEWTFGTGASWNGFAEMDGCDLTGDYYYFGKSGTSNNVTRLVGSTVTATNHVFVGYESGAKDVRVEIDGGTLACRTVMIGKPGSVRCGVRVSGSPTLNIAGWIIGDALGGASARAFGSWTEFAETTNTLPKLLVGAGSANAYVLVTNASVTVRSGDHFVVGRDAGATGNVLRVVRGGVCRYETVGGKGDFYVGQNAGANGNRLELDGGTFAYDRRFMAVGFEGSSNVLSVANGARFDAADGQLWVGYRTTAKGNRLVLRDGGVATVRMLNLQNDAVAEFVGVGNELTIGNENVSVVDGTSFVFRPSPAAATTPVVTVNKTLTYGPNRPITVDVANVEPGVYRLMACAVGVPAVDGVPVTYENLPRTWRARLRRSSDGKELQLVVSSQEMVFFVR